MSDYMEEQAKRLALATGTPLLVSATGLRLHYEGCWHLELEARPATQADIEERNVCFTCTQGGAASRQTETRPAQVCPKCFLQMPASGECC